ncbi:sodium:proton antiporter [Alkalilimnicola sp. S0819]|uniref:sodium:proton antiporter n=1 Tax=Alkalilimnicola sp. S0819 TaxID=2613922 RepID=UPI00126214F7|nr:sodium:proton antiporter [Alkalilimnicola sp. S0819]KAB7627478.1 Na+/H+ antiporter subunit C [Alkalilimnicola sp. S0819]MPQ15630.1 Na+/H+ antiporter subunit C [Alkalilimnicola sp. S0819]
MNAPLYAVIGALLFVMALRALFLSPHLLHKLIAGNIAASGVFLTFIGQAGVTDGAVDPVPQALVLTGIVISVSITAFALSVLRRLHECHGHAHLEASRPRKRQ